MALTDDTYVSLKALITRARLLAAKSGLTKYYLSAEDKRVLATALTRLGDSDVALIIAAGKGYGIPVGGGAGYTNTLPPPIPRGVNAVNGSGTITGYVDQTGGMHDGTAASDGVASYVMNVGGVDLYTVAAPNANIQAAHTVSNIGGVSPSPGLSVSGRQVTVTSAGTGFDGTSDQLTMIDAKEETGTFARLVRLKSFTGTGSDYAYTGLMARATPVANLLTATTVRYVAWYQWLLASGQGLQAAYRAADAASKTNIDYISGDSTARDVLMEGVYSAGTWTFTLKYSTDGGTWVSFTTHQETTWPSTITVGEIISNLAASGVLTTQHEDGIRKGGAQAQVSQAHATGTSVDVKWKAVGVNGVSSGYTPIVSASGDAGGGGGPPNGDLVKYNPGLYLRGIPSGTSNTWYYAMQVPSVMSQWQGYVDANSDIGAKGFFVTTSWISIETSFGVYSSTVLDQIYDKLSSYGMRLILTVNMATQFVQNSQTFPQYMRDDIGTYFVGASADNIWDVTVRFWDSTVIARIEALNAYIAAWAETKSKVEAVTVIGTEMAFPGGYTLPTGGTDSTYTAASTASARSTLLAHWKSVAPTTMGGLMNNGIKHAGGSNSYVLGQDQTLMALMSTNNTMFLNPNSVHNDADFGFVGLLGIDEFGATPTGGSAYPDWTLAVPVCAGMGEDNDYYAYNTYGSPSAWGPPYQSLDTMYADWTAARTVTSWPGEIVHSSPLSLPFLRPSHGIALINDGRGGDSTNQWAPTGRAKAATWAAAWPSRAVPTSFGGNYITGG